MKRCPTCNRTFTDPNLSFCIEDGTPLIKSIEPAYDSEATIVSTSSSPAAPDSETQSSSDNGWSSPAYQPPPKFPPPPPSQRRRVWPWVVGSIGLLVIVFAGLGIAAAVFIPQMMKESVRNNRNSGISTNTRSNENQNGGANANANDNSNSTGLNQNEGVNENRSETEPPTNEEVVLADLKNIEDEWTVANLNADKKKLAKILADDYVSMVNGKMQGKADYLRDIKPDPNIQHWEFRDLKLKLNGSRATLEGVVSLESSQESETQSLKFTDKFVWRDSRWQAVSSEVAPAKETK